jgi:hypothetical protein
MSTIRTPLRSAPLVARPRTGAAAPRIAHTAKTFSPRSAEVLIERIGSDQDLHHLPSPVMRHLKAEHRRGRNHLAHRRRCHQRHACCRRLRPPPASVAEALVARDPGSSRGTVEDSTRLNHRFRAGRWREGRTWNNTRPYRECPKILSKILEIASPAGATVKPWFPLWAPTSIGNLVGKALAFPRRQQQLIRASPDLSLL